MSKDRRVAFTLKNDRDELLPVFVEPWPEHFKLRKGERLEIVFEPRQDIAEVVEIVAHDEGLTVYPGSLDDAAITIDGKNAEARSWCD